jgi:1,4-alpha-glucan branching enzyme
MSVKKRFLKSKPMCKVTFKLSKAQTTGAEKAALVGDFNGWDTGATPMNALKSGGFSVTVDLETGKEYQFRYLLDGERWENDSAADRYVPTEYPGIENGIVAV